MLIDAIERFFVSRDIRPSRLVVAVSGGVDSTALLLALAEVRDRPFTLVAAHVNHHLRAGESDDDEQFVRDTCDRLGIPLTVVSAPLEGDAVRACGVEGAARALRREHLQHIRSSVSADFILTAHQQNDQAETVLMRIIGGSGVLRLAGIQPVTEDGYLRPLLGVSRVDIEAFLADRGIHPRRDTSNADLRFVRNRIRHDLIPLLLGYNPAVIQTIAGTAADALELRDILAPLVAIAEAAVVEREEGSSRIRLSVAGNDGWMLRTLISAEIRRLDPEARDVSATDLRRIVSGTAGTTRFSVTKNLEAIVTGDTLTLGRRTLPASPFELRLHAGVPAGLPDGRRLKVSAAVSVHTLDAIQAKASDRFRQLFQLPEGAAPDFVVRTRRTGERIRPFGLAHEKKLKSLLIDRKIPKDLRDSIPLLFWEERIVWVAGVTLADEFRVTDSPGDVYEATLESP